MILVKNLLDGTLRTCSYAQFHVNFHQAHAHRHPFPSGMINNYYIHSSMALLFLPFISMLIPREYELATMSEEEEEQGDKTNQGNKMKKKKTQNNPQGMFKSHEYKSHMASLPRISCNPFSP
jgi:hypothetical protein